ncbi:MAG: calcium/sodium antiporter [bacterium]|nr:calcium/sodium antiporter [bacterium]
MMYVWLLVGFVLLIKGADFFVEGSSSVAKLLRVPSVIIGLTIVAFGTSAPEAAVSITAAIAQKNEIAVGNVIGSNIFNLLVVVGACALIMPMPIDKKILWKDYPFSLVITAVLMGMMLLDLKVGRLDGIVLLLFFAYFLFRTVQHALQNRTEEAGEEVKVLTPTRSVLYIAVGIVAIVLGGDLVVDSASEIAAAFGLSQTLIGLTIVAMGTSLPELVTSLVAAGKGENELALGNVVGSNIFNILFVLSMSSVISEIPVQMESVFDVAILLVFSVITWVFCKTSYQVKRLEGACMLLLYAGYMVYIILR